MGGGGGVAENTGEGCGQLWCVVCIEEGWGGDSLDTTTAAGYHRGGPSLIHIPLMPVGNLWDRHALSKHKTHSPPPTPLRSQLPLLRMWTQWHGGVCLWMRHRCFLKSSRRRPQPKIKKKKKKMAAENIGANSLSWKTGGWLWLMSS